MASLQEFLAENSAAKAEHDSLIAKATEAGETAGKIEGNAEGKAEGIDEMKAVYAVALPILSSTHYPEAVKTRVGEKAQAGDVEGVKDYVSMFDSTAEGIATAKAIEEQAEETPATGPQSDAEKSEQDFQARLTKEGGA